jgi:hypothetical protein
MVDLDPRSTKLGQGPAIEWRPTFVVVDACAGPTVDVGIPANVATDGRWDPISRL